MIDLNSHNQTYYQTHGTVEVPDLLASAPPIQEAIRRMIESVITSDPIRVMELGFGSRPDRYHHIANQSSRSWQVTLSDFSLDVLPPLTSLPQSPNIIFTYQQLDLLSTDLTITRSDVILSTYTFDSIEFPEDRYEQSRHYPGGMIRLIKQFLESSRIFITIDKTESQDRYEPAGGAQFKALDLQATASALEDDGYHVTLESLNEFLERFHQKLPINLSDHSCLTVYKR